MADNLLDKASILLTPTAYDNGSMLSIKPENGDGDFDFQRNSAATRVNAQGLVEKAITNAEWYSRRFIDFMSFNQATYPEYTSNSNDDIYPSYDSTFNGWVL